MNFLPSLRNVAGTLFLGTILLTGCDKADIEKGTPACIKDEINSLRDSTPCTQGANVKEYVFQSRTVYVFDQGSCGADFMYDVIDADCHTLGQLGGLAGFTRINGEDFYRNATYRRTVWAQ